jgi:hypothetical protein
MIKKFLSLMKALKKDPPQNKTQTKEKQKTQNPSSLSLFTFVILLSVDASAVIITIIFLCSSMWLHSYVPPC